MTKKFLFVAILWSCARVHGMGGAAPVQAPAPVPAPRTPPRHVRSLAQERDRLFYARFFYNTLATDPNQTHGQYLTAAYNEYEAASARVGNAPPRRRHR